MQHPLLTERLARLRSWQEGRPAPPWSLEIGLTMRCDLGCRMCWRHNPERRILKEEVSVERWLSLIDEAASVGVREVRVIGEGEPLFRKGAPEVLERIKRRGLKGFITTAGHRIDRDLACNLAAWGWDTINVSVHGASAPVHDFITQVPGSFDRLVNGIRWVEEERLRLGGAVEPWVSISCCVTRTNRHDVLDLIDRAAEWGVRSVWYEPTTVNSDKSRELKLESGELTDFLQRAHRKAADARRLGVATNLGELNEDIMLASNHMDRVLLAAPAGKRLMSSPCLNPFWLLAARANGQVSACGYYLDRHTDNIAELGVEGAWRGPWMDNIRQRMMTRNLLDMCRHCCSASVLETVAIKGDLRGVLEQPPPSPAARITRASSSVPVP